MVHSGRVSLAVLIDAENVSHRQADEVFELAKKLGEVRVRRLYGNHAGWDAAVRRHALGTGRVFAGAAGKNGADIALTIDAVDLLRDGATTGFCIVSSDSDFTGLAMRIRQEGKLAYGIGLKKSVQSYRDSCTEFHFLHPVAALAAVPAAASLSPEDALPVIERALANIAAREGWYHLGAVGSQLRKAGFNPKGYGHAKLGKLLEKTRRFTFKGTEWFRPLSAPVQLRPAVSGH
jgi:hypothetical protein